MKVTRPIFPEEFPCHPIIERARPTLSSPDCVLTSKKPQEGKLEAGEMILVATFADVRGGSAIHLSKIYAGTTVVGVELY